MNKPLLSSGSAIRVFRASAILFALLFVVGAGTSMAQTDRQVASTLAGSQGISKPSTPNSSSAVFVSNTDAVQILKGEVSTLEANSSGTSVAQALNGTQASYFAKVATGVMKGGSIADIFDSSAFQLQAIIAQYPLADRPDFATIRQNLFDLVTQ